MTNWIKIEEKEPILGEYIVCFNKEKLNSSFFGAYVKNNKVIILGHFFASEIVIEITHWMPLPEVPNE